MASKRKSTIPCMIPSKTMRLREELEQDPPCLPRQARDQAFLHRVSGGGRQSPLVDLGESSRPEGGSALKDGGGTYTCRPCNFETHDLNLFLDHVYSGHPDFRADPSFHCVDCGVSAAKFEGLALHNARVHPSTLTTTLQLRRRDRRLVVEQSLVTGTEAGRETEISITKTPIMRMLKGKSEPKRIVVSHSSASDDASQEPLLLGASASREGERKETPTVTVTHVPTIVHNGAATKVSLPSAIQIVNGSGALPMLKTAITQVVSVFQNRQLQQQSAPITVSSAFSSTSTSASSKNMPKVMIPLSSIPTYSASMDSSSFLKTSFSKFPYPTKAELCYLTVVTKFPEEQIKIWFTAQRLKQGISWSPEEIEEARRKMFNTIIQTAPPSSQHQRQNPSQGHHGQAQHTITVLPASLGPTGIPHILQGSLVSQGGVIVTQPMMANGIQVSSAPMALAVTPKPQAAARPMMQARPAAALVADKGISMVVGTVGSSSSGSSNIISSSSSSNGGGSTSSISSISSSSSSINSNSNSSIISHPSVINLSIGSSNYSNTNGKVNTAKLISTNANLNGKSNIVATSYVSSAKSNTDNKTAMKNSDGNKPTSSSSSTVKSFSESKVITDIKSSAESKANNNNNNNSKNGNNTKNGNSAQKCKDAISASSNSASGHPATTTSIAVSVTNTAGNTPTGNTPTPTGNTPAVKAERSSSPAIKSSSPSPAATTNSASGVPSSRTLPNTVLDPSFYKSKKSHEQLGRLKESFLTNQFPNQEEVDRLISLTGLTVREVRKWFSDRRYHFRNLKGSRASMGSQGNGKSATGTSGSTPGGSGAPMDLSDGATSAETPRTPQHGSAPLSPPPSQTPTSPTTPSRRPPGPSSPTTPSRRPPRAPSPDFTAIRYKERDPQQVRALESSFSQDPEPSGEEVDRLRTETKMTRREIHGWFAERRKRVAAEKKKEDLERAEREEEMEEQAAKESRAEGEEGRSVGEEGGKSDDGMKKEEDTEEGKDERQKEDGPGSELKVNPIKINLKMLKVTEANGKAETEGGPASQSGSPTMPPPSTPNLTPSPSPATSATTTPKPAPSQSAKPSPSPKPASSPKPTPIRGKKTAEQLHLLKQVYARTQWPSSVQYDELISATGLPRPEVVRWFGDCRYVQKNGQLKWLEAYQCMVLEEDLQRGDITMLRAHLEAHGSLEEGQVLELAQASGLTEELVRRWFSSQSALAPPPSQTTLPLATPPSQTTLPLATPLSQTTLPLATPPSQTTLPLATPPSQTTLPLATPPSQTTLPLATPPSQTTLPLATPPSQTTLPLATPLSQTTLPLATPPSQTTLPLATPPSQTTLPLATPPSQTTLPLATPPSQTTLPLAPPPSQTTLPLAPPPSQTTLAPPLSKTTLPLAPPPSQTTLPLAPPPSQTTLAPPLSKTTLPLALPPSQTILPLAPPPSKTTLPLAPPPSKTTLPLAPPPSKTTLPLALPPSQTTLPLAPPPSKTTLPLAPPPSKTTLPLAPPPSKKTLPLAPPPSKTTLPLAPPPSQTTLPLAPPPSQTTLPPSQAEGGGGAGGGENTGTGGGTVTPSPVLASPCVGVSGSASLPEPEQGDVKEERMEQSLCGVTEEGEEKTVGPGNPAKGTD